MSENSPIIFNSSLADEIIAREGMLNILSLGAKNDGSEDISEIVNAYTESYALFFPAGIYKVSKPLVIRNPISGSGYARTPSPDMAHTWLISDIEHKDTDIFNETGVVTFGGSGRFTVENLNIICRDHECGICINPCIQSTATFVDRVGIYGVRGYGILAVKGNDVPGFASRPVFFQNLTIFGTSDYSYPSVGIYLGDRIGDNRFSNIEIMGTRIGVYQDASFVYADNMHIWTGCLGQRDNGSWWETTRGIILGHGDANFIASNIYVDTSFYLLEFNSCHDQLSIHNFMTWEDGSIGGCDRTGAKLFHLADGMTGTPNISLIDGLVYVSGNDENPGKLSDLFAPTPNAKIENVRILSNYSICAKNLRRLAFADTAAPNYSMKYEKTDTDRAVLAAAVAAEAENGECQLTYTDSNGAVAVICVSRDNGKTEISFEKQRRTGDRLSVNTDDNGLITVMVKVPAGEELDMSINTAYASHLVFPIDLSILKDFPTYTQKTITRTY